MKRRLPKFDKYYHYINSVQSPAMDVRFFRQVYREVRQHIPDHFTLSEDFCGTFITCCEWVKLGSGYVAHGLDLDQEPLAYGRAQHLPRLAPDQQARLHIQCRNVLANGLPKVDIIAALNFSYFLFQERQRLKEYFTNCLHRLTTGGVLIIDSFGGAKCQEANEEETQITDLKFNYYWEQSFFDPVTNHAVFHIHFKRRGEKKRQKIFTYDWRMWSIPELKDVLREVGFKDVMVYWEGTTRDGEGNGRFRRVTRVREECESWVAYIAACK